MVIITGDNSFSLYGHAGRGFNMIMTLKNGRFRYSEPMFSLEWAEGEDIPLTVLAKYKPKEKKALMQYWGERGYFLEN